MTAEGDGRQSGGLCCRMWRPEMFYDSWGCRRWRPSCRVGELRSSVCVPLHISRPIYMCACDCIVQFYLQMYSMHIYRINDFWLWLWLICSKYPYVDEKIMPLITSSSELEGCPYINSLWPSDAIWRQRFRSTLAQVMACCLTAPSHYLNQCWLIIILSPVTFI